MILWHRQVNPMKDAAKLKLEEVEAARLEQEKQVDELIKLLEKKKKEEEESNNVQT